MAKKECDPTLNKRNLCLDETLDMANLLLLTQYCPAYNRHRCRVACTDLNRETISITDYSVGYGDSANPVSLDKLCSRIISIISNGGHVAAPSVACHMPFQPSRHSQKVHTVQYPVIHSYRTSSYECITTAEVILTSNQIRSYIFLSIWC